MVGILFHGDNHFVVRGPLPDRDAARALIRHWSIIQISSGARMKLDTRAVIESGEGLAVLHDAWSLGPPSATQGLSTDVVRRQPDCSWMFVIDNPNTQR